MIYTFKPFEITKELEDDCLQLSKEFFEKLAVIQEKHSITDVMIANDWVHGLSYNLFTEENSVSCFLNTHQQQKENQTPGKTQ